MLGLRGHRGARLLEIFRVVLGDAGIEDIEDNLGGLIEALARGVHVHAEGAVFFFGQPTTKAEQEPIAEHHLQQRDLLGDAGGIFMPWKNNRAGTNLDAVGFAGEIGQPL